MAGSEGCERRAGFRGRIWRILAHIGTHWAIRDERYPGGVALAGGAT